MKWVEEGNVTAWKWRSHDSWTCTSAL